MRVAHVVKQFWPSLGGIEDATLNLVLQQRDRQGIDAHVVTLDRTFADGATTLPSSEVHRGIPIRRMPWKGSKRFPVAPSVLREIAGFDLVHVHGIDFFFDFLAATKLVHGRPMVASTHGGFFHTDFAARAKRLYFAIVTRASVRAYLAIGGSSKADTEMFTSLRPRHLVTIENGVDTSKFADAASSQYARNIIYFGRLASHKKINALFPLLAELRGSDAGWSLTIAGAPGDQTMDQLRAAAAAGGVGEAVTFASSPDEAMLRDLIGQASYFACASSHEGFGLAAIEAMSAGLVPLLSPIPTFTDFVERAGVGLLFDPEAPRDAARLVRDLDARMAEEHSRLRRRAMDATADYGWEAAADAYAALYRKVLAGKPASA